MWEYYTEQYKLFSLEISLKSHCNLGNNFNQLFIKQFLKEYVWMNYKIKYMYLEKKENIHKILKSRGVA